MASFLFTKFAKNLAKANVDFDTDTLKVLLVSSVPTTVDSTGNQDTWEFRSDVSNEITGTGYSSGGIAQAFTLNTVSSSGQSITMTNITNGWTSSTFSAVGAIIYVNKGSAASDILIGFVDFGGTVSCTNGNYSITYTSSLNINPAV